MQFQTADGHAIFISEERANHLAAHPDVLEFLPEAISKIVIGDATGRLKKEVGMGRIVGTAGLVDTPDITLTSETYFAFRTHRKFPSHISMEGKGKASDTITVSVDFDESTKKWMLITAYIGYFAPSEPLYFFDPTSFHYEDSSQFKESLHFWMTHALLYDPLVTGTPYISTWEKEIEKVKNQYLSS